MLKNKNVLHTYRGATFIWGKNTGAEPAISLLCQTSEVSLCFAWVIFLLKMNVQSLQERPQSAMVHLNHGFGCVHGSRVYSVSPKKTPRSCLVLNQWPLFLQLRSEQKHKKLERHFPSSWAMGAEASGSANEGSKHLSLTPARVKQFSTTMLLLWDKQIKLNSQSAPPEIILLSKH